MSPTFQRPARLSLVLGICTTLTLMVGAHANAESEANDSSVPSQTNVTAEQLPGVLGSRFTNSIGTPSAGAGPTCDDPNSCQLPDIENFPGGTILTSALTQDNFVPTTSGDVTAACWWGAYIDFSGPDPVDCGPGPGDNFTITYYSNNPGCPTGAPNLVIASFDVVASKMATGLDFILGGFPDPVAEYAFSASHPAVPVTAGNCYWIEITNDTSPSDCIFFWEVSPLGPGDGSNSGGSPVTFDMAWCIDLGLDPDTSACALPIDPACEGAKGDCGEPNGTPGCDDGCCCTLVCVNDPFCCQVDWDQGCVDTAIKLGCATEPIPPYACVDPGPPNDCCTDPMIVFDGDVIFFDTTNANTDGVLDPSNPCNSAMEDAQIWKDLWYLYNATQTGVLTASVCFDPTDFDTKIAAYAVGTPVYSCDDVPNLLLSCNEDCEPNAPFRSSLGFGVTAGDTYLIRLGSYSPTANEQGAEFGPGLISFELEIPPDLPEGFYLDPAEFQAALNLDNKVLKGVENFPWEADLASVIGVDDPLDVTTSVPGWIQPGVLLDNVTYQSNGTPFGAGGPMPGPIQPGLALFTPGFIGSTSNGLVANHFVDSLDIISGPPAGDSHTAISMTLVSFNNVRSGGTITVSVYDKQENLLATAENLHAFTGGGLFLGILLPGNDTIGRVNLYDTTPGFDAEGVYNVAVYVLGKGQPCPWDLDDDGNVGVGDLLELLAGWNNPYGVGDLLAMLAAWGACP